MEKIVEMQKTIRMRSKSWFSRHYFSALCILCHLIHSKILWSGHYCLQIKKQSKRTQLCALDTFSSVGQSCSRCSTLCDPMNCSKHARLTYLSITNYQTLLKLMSIESVMPSSHLTLWRPLLLPPSIFPSIRVFSNESALGIRQPKDWCFSISPSSEYPGLISFRMDSVDPIAVQGTLKRPPKYCKIISLQLR